MLVGIGQPDIFINNIEVVQMEPVKIKHILKDGSVVTNLKDVAISADEISLAVKKAIYEMIISE